MHHQNQTTKNSGARSLKSATTIMARYTITYKCGHTAEVQLYGKESERQRKIAWYATIDCPECEAREQKELAEKMALPELTGSEKQIAWAVKIRNKAIEAFDAANNRNADYNRQLFADMRDEWLKKETASKYWIDNCYDLESAKDVMDAIKKSVPVPARPEAETKMDFEELREEIADSKYSDMDEATFADAIKEDLVTLANAGKLTQDMIDNHLGFFSRHDINTNLSEAVRLSQVDEMRRQMRLNIGRQLFEGRICAGLNPIEVSRRLGIHPDTLQAIEGGAKDVDIDMLTTLAHMYRCEIKINPMSIKL